RRAYAEWYDWARREVGADPARMHAAASAALQLLDQGASPADAASAALAAAGPKPAPAPSPAAQTAAQTASQAAPATHPAAPPAAPAPPPAPVAPSQPWAPQAPAPQAPVQQASYQPYAPPSYAPLAPGPYAAAAPPPAPTRAYAGFGRRLAAYVIDAVLLAIGLVALLVVLSVFALVGLLSSGQDLADPNLNLGLSLSLYAIAFVLSWLYFAGLESSAWQATV